MTNPVKLHCFTGSAVKNNAAGRRGPGRTVRFVAVDEELVPAIDLGVYRRSEAEDERTQAVMVVG